MSVQTQPNQESFNAGEFGERMAARVQFAKYANAGATYENILPLPQGGFTYRPGSRYIADCKSHSVRSWLLPFIFSNLQSYVLETSEERIRFFRNQAQIVANDIGAAITNGTFDTDVASWTAAAGTLTHDGTNNRMIISASGGRAQQSVTTTTTNVEHVLRFEVHGVAGDKLTVRVGSTAGGSEYLADKVSKAGYHLVAFTPTASPFYVEFQNDMGKTVSIDDISLLDDVPIELWSPYAEADLPNLSYVQSADVMYFALGGATHVYRLDRFGHSSWSLTQVLFNDGPYLDENITATTLAASAGTGTGVTITASSTTGINDDTGFRATDVGRLIRMKSGSNYGFCQITDFTSTTQVTADVLGESLPTSGNTNWRLGEFNDTDGWPSVVSFIQQRMALASTTKEPQKFWLSVSGDIENFADSDKAGDVLDDSSIVFKLAAQRVNTILWFAARKKPIIGTQDGNWTLRSEGAILKPSDIAADFEVSSGCARIPPLEIRSRLVFAQKQLRKVVEFADVIQSNGLEGFDAFDLTLLNDRILKDGVVQMAYAQEPDSVVWCARGDGQLSCLTYQPDQDVLGWSRQILGGTFHGGSAVVESVATIPGQSASGQFKSSDDRDEVWVVVKREINGSTKRYIECIEKIFNGDEDLQEDAFYVDSGLTLNNPISISAITKADPGVVTTATAHGLSNGDDIRITRVKGMTELNNTSFKVAGVTSTTFQLQDTSSVNVNTTSFTTYSTGGEVREKVSSVSGLAHLEGESVQVFADGAVQTNKTVSSGAITLDAAASLVHVGLPYTRQFKSLKLSFGARDGSAIGKPKSISDIILVVMETGEGALTLSTIEDGVTGTATELDLRSATDIDGDPVNFFTGELRLGVTAGFDDDIRILLQGSTPTPATVLALSPEIDTSS
jgi:hypothetical protein